MSTGAAAARELYVYWKTATADRAMAAVRQAQGTLESGYPGLRARVLRREALGPAVVTVMEIYTRSVGIDSQLQAVIDDQLGRATDGLREGPRHTEVFVAA